MFLGRWFCKTGPRQFLRRRAQSFVAQPGVFRTGKPAWRSSFLRNPVLPGKIALAAIAAISVSMLSWAQSSGGASQSSPEAGQGPRAKVTNPHGPTIGSCQNCHTYTSWKPIRSMPEFNHDETRYPLRGLHQSVPCTKCHQSMVFRNVSTHCSDCHADIHMRQMGANCENCHSVKGWQVSTRQIQNHTNRFPLVGAHAMAECADCHKGAATGQFMGLSTACYSCHAQDAKNAPIDHTSFPKTCDTCHSMDNWLGAKFDHLAVTGYALTGMHATLECTACHVNNKFAGTPSACYSCHQQDFNSTSNPPHAQANFPRDCGVCHSTTNWLNAKFDHGTFAGYPLTGMHATLTCAQCHVNNQYVNTPTDCYSCHKADYTSATNPNHVASGFPTSCATCHTTSGWSPATFDHAKTGFPLTGAHATVACTQCHVNNNYSSLPTDCYGCHKADFNGTNNPAHVAAGFPTNCAICHTTVNWANASFNHATMTGYALTGMHATLTCLQCHLNGNYTNTPVDCYSCHKADFTSTNNPNHVTSGFPTDCSICHTTSSWSPSSFDHSKTAFPLTGAHLTVACAQCHVNNNYTTLPTACYGCHQADYNNTNNPAHAAAGFPTDCTVCHTTSSWAGAVFDHSKTPFPLTGAHVNVACTLCHVNGVFAGTPTDCYSCHQGDYNKTSNPNHSSAGFPTTCATCHTTTSWSGATFNHTWFPTNHGGANGVCATCHTNSADYSAFTCTNCHAKTSTDQAHSGIKTYVYNSVNCYACHKSGGGG